MRAGPCPRDSNIVYHHSAEIESFEPQVMYIKQSTISFAFADFLISAMSFFSWIFKFDISFSISRIAFLIIRWFSLTISFNGFSGEKAAPMVEQIRNRTCWLMPWKFHKFCASVNFRTTSVLRNVKFTACNERPLNSGQSTEHRYYLFYCTYHSPLSSLFFGKESAFKFPSNFR